MPLGVAGAVLTLPGIFGVLFQYDGFPVSYESGLSGVPQFDAHIEVYSSDKIVRVEFDTPYIQGPPGHHDGQGGVLARMASKSARFARHIRTRTRWSFWISTNA